MPQQSIGPYRIIGKLGEGGMGEVFEAMHETIERRVAIKLLHPDRARDREVAARFLNEARAVNRIEHTGLVQISDCNQTSDGSIYIVMELLRGATLGQRLKERGRLTPAEAVTMCRQISSALVAVHDKGIVHRDATRKHMVCLHHSGILAQRRRPYHGHAQCPLLLPLSPTTKISLRCLLP